MVQATLKQRAATTAVRGWLDERTVARLGLAALLLVTLVMGLFSLLRTPAPMNDEAWNASRAWSIVQSGRAFSSLDSGIFDKFDGYWTMFPWLGIWLQSLALRVLGLSILSVRLVSLFFGLLLLVTVFAVGDRAGGPRVGLGAVLLLSMSRMFVYSSHLARHDIMVATCGFGAIALCMSEQSPRAWGRSLLAGLAIGVGMEMHPYGAVYAPAIGALFLMDHGWSVLRTRRLWAFSAGVLGGLFFYAALHILPYPQTYAALQSLAFGPTHVPPILTLDPRVLLASLVDAVRLFVDYSRWRIPFIVASLFFLWRWRSVTGSRLTVLFVVLVLASVALMRNKSFFQYAIHFFPAADLLVAAFLVALWDRLSRVRSSIRSWPYLRAALMLALLAAAILPGQRRILANPMDDYEATLSQVRATIPPGTTVMGPQLYWFAMPDQRYLSWEGIIFYQRYAPGTSPEQALQALHPDYFIIDGPMEHFLWSDEGMSRSAYAEPLFIPKDQLMGFLDRNAHLVGSIETDTYGDVRMYKIDWK